jgi:hypothetical protein
VTCIRSDKPTIISDLVTGNKYNDNAMIGESYHYKTVDKSALDKVGAGLIDNHLAGYMASAMLSNKKPLDPLPPQKAVLADDAYLVSQGDRLWRDFKTAALLGAPALKNSLVSEFDTKAGQATAVDLHEKPVAGRQTFSALSLPAPALEKPSSSPVVATKGHHIEV